MITRRMLKSMLLAMIIAIVTLLTIVTIVQGQTPTPRHLTIAAHGAVLRQTDSLAAVAFLEQRERGGCVLGYWTHDTATVNPVDSLVLDTVLEPQVADSLRTADGITFSCRSTVAVAAWHSHQPSLPVLLPPKAWCQLSAKDTVATEVWARERGIYLDLITVVPGIRCGWWFDPRTGLHRLDHQEQN